MESLCSHVDILPSDIPDLYYPNNDCSRWGNKDQILVP